MTHAKGNPRTAKNNPILQNIRQQFSGEVHRPGHMDFMTTLEFAATQRSGIRDNEIAQQFEMWIVGECVFTVSYDEVIMDKEAWNKKSKIYFNL